MDPLVICAVPHQWFSCLQKNGADLLAFDLLLSQFSDMEGIFFANSRWLELEKSFLCHTIPSCFFYKCPANLFGCVRSEGKQTAYAFFSPPAPPLLFGGGLRPGRARGLFFCIVQSLGMLDLALCKPFLAHAARGKANRFRVFLSPRAPSLFPGAPRPGRAMTANIFGA